MRTTVIYSPHPDDETLYTSAYITFAARRGDRLILVAVTDGGASGARPSTWTASDLMTVRAHVEQEAAWRALTALSPETQVIRLGEPDGAISSQAVQNVATALERAYGREEVEHYVAGNYTAAESTDHRAVATGVKAAGVKVARFASDPRVFDRGTVYTPSADDVERATAADDRYSAFGHSSVPNAFAALRANGYASRVFA